MNPPNNALRPVRGNRNAAAPIRRRPRPAIPEIPEFDAARGDRDSAYAEFLPAALKIIETPPSRLRTAVGYLLCGTISAALLWSLFGHLTLFAVASGQFQARGGTQVVQPNVAGQVSSIRVKDGDHVGKGQVVIEMDPTTARANKTVIQDKLNDQRAEVVRLKAEIAAARKKPVDKTPSMSWPADLPDAVRTREESVLRADLAQLAATISDLMAERQAKETATGKFNANIVAQKSLIAAHSERTAMHERLASQGWDSRVKVLDALEPLRQEQVSLAEYQGSLAEAEAAISLIDGDIAKTLVSFVTKDTQALVLAEREIEDLVQQLAKADQAVRDASLRSPVAGTVHAAAVTTVGQEVNPGQQLLQIVPDGEPLEIQAYVLNTDIGFVRPGQKATIKVDTFPYTRYGTIEGTVTKVAADAITGRMALQQQKDGALPDSHGALSVTNAAQQTSDLVFPVTITPSKQSILVDGRETPLSPGMSVAVEIETDRQRAITYILYPLTRALPQTAE